MTENGFGNVLSNPSDLIGQFDADALVLVKMIFHGRLNLMHKVHICTPNIWSTSKVNPGFVLTLFWPHVVECAPNLQQLPLDSSGLFGPLCLFRLAGLGGSFPNHS